MEIMTLHKFGDDCIEKVVYKDYIPELREIVLKETCENSLYLNKDDIIAFAKEFNLAVYEKDSELGRGN